jgi:hypothetical protein
MMDTETQKDHVETTTIWQGGHVYHATVDGATVLLGREDIALAQREADRARGGFARMVCDSEARMKREA